MKYGLTEAIQQLLVASRQRVRGLNCWKYIKKNCCMNCGAGMCFWGVWSEGDMFSYEQGQHEKEIIKIVI